MVVIVDDPKRGPKEDNLIVRDGTSPCKHLVGDKPGEYSCAVHHFKWYKKTPCFSHGQIERSINDECRMGAFVIRRMKEDAEGNEQGRCKEDVPGGVRGTTRNVHRPTTRAFLDELHRGKHRRRS